MCVCVCTCSGVNSITSAHFIDFLLCITMKSDELPGQSPPSLSPFTRHPPPTVRPSFMSFCLHPSVPAHSEGAGAMSRVGKVWGGGREEFHMKERWELL